MRIDTTHLLPRVYCASKWERAPMWTLLRKLYFDNRIHVVSSWHDSPTLEVDDAHPGSAFTGWTNNLRELKTAEHLLVYGEHKDRLNGTLMEVGYAAALSLPIHLVGNFPWGSWRHLDNVTEHDTLRAAIEFIVHSKEFTDDPT